MSQITKLHTMEQQPISLTDCILSGATIEHCEKNYTFPLHLHSVMEIYRICSGECDMTIQGKAVHCKEGDFVLLLPNVIHSFCVPSSSDCSFIHLHFNPQLFSSLIIKNDGVFPITLLNAILLSTKFYYSFTSDAILDAILDQVLALYDHKKGMYYAARINTTLFSLMMYILENTEYSLHHETSSLQNSYIAFTLQYIERNYAKKIKQEDIAEQLQISIRYLSKLFRENVGMPLSTYINIYRINKAIDLMKDPDRSLTDIAYQVGLTNSQHFSKVFRDFINVSPSKYRKMLGQEK